MVDEAYGLLGDNSSSLLEGSSAQACVLLGGWAKLWVIPAEGARAEPCH